MAAQKTAIAAIALLALALSAEARDLVFGKLLHQVSRSEKLELLRQARAQDIAPPFAPAPAPDSPIALPSEISGLPPQGVISGLPPASPGGGGSGISGVTALTNCPTSPLQYCDFYFEGFESAVPLLTIPADATGDVAISPPVRDSKRNSSDPLGYVEVDSTSPANFLCPAPPGTSSDGSNPDLGNNFYITTNNGGAVVQVRNLQNLGNDTVLDSRCVLLPITSAQVFPAGSQVVTNINKEDGNTEFPEDRRCVVFQTGPEAFFCQAVAPSPVAVPPSACPTATCTGAPTAECDFFFQGFEASVPTFSLSQVKPDQAFTPPAQYATGNGTVTIEIDSTGPVCTPVANEDSVFYGTMSSLNARVFQQGPAAYANQCYKVPLTSVQITFPNTNSPVNVNSGDNNPGFPEDRRCILFATST